MKRGVGIHSLSVKLAALFLAIIWLSSLTVSVIAHLVAIPEINKSISRQMVGYVQDLRRLVDKGELSPESLVFMGRNNEITPRFVDDIIETAQWLDKSEEETAALLKRAELGEIVTGMGDRGPFCFARIGNRMFLLTAGLENNRVFYYIKGVGNSLFFFAVIGSILIVGASTWVVRRIRHISEATEEVARGNFEITLSESSRDELGQFARDFNLMVKTLRSNEYLRKDFVSSVSHELKTPISSIQGFARLIRKPGLSKEQLEEYADVIIKETKRLSNLSANLLRLSELDTTAIQIKSESFSLDEQIRDIILLLERNWNEKNLELDIDLDEVDYTGDEELLSQVWINLIQNAIKFSDQDGRIRVSLRRRNPYIRVEISDTGIGISEEHQKRIFERFYQGDSSHSNEGSGLGLSIVKKIIALAGGSITLKSVIGQGSTFTVNLPMAPDKDS